MKTIRQNKSCGSPNFGKVLVAAGAVLFLQGAFGARFNSQSYVQDGLLVQFDAIENVGVGQPHDATATTWYDLKGSATLAVPSGVTWIDRALDAGRVALYALNMPAFYLDSAATEVAMNNLGHGNAYPRPFKHPDGDGVYTVYFSPGFDSPQFFINGISSPRPAFGTFLSGTLGMASDTTNFRTYNNGVYKNSSGSTVVPHKEAAAKHWDINVQNGYLQALYRALRHYNRPLTDAEFAANALIDQIRFFSFVTTGTSAETPVAWADLAWTAPYGRTETQPTTLTNDVARILSTKVSVGADDGVMLRVLSLEEGASLVIPEGAEVCVRVLFVETQRFERGIYTGPEGRFGKRVDWISGAGRVLVSGENATKFPRATGGLGPDSYVQEGLVTQFDAIDNAGTGTHDATATLWCDLVGGASVPTTTETSWLQGRYFDKGGEGGRVYLNNMPSYRRDSITCDVPINIHESGVNTLGSYPRIFAHGEAFSIYFDGAGTSALLYINGQTGDYRPELGKFRIGTIAGFSGASGYGGAIDGVVKGKRTVPVTNAIRSPAGQWEFGFAGKMLAAYGGLRFYNRCLSTEELAWNTRVDKFRFFSYRFENAGEQVDWSGLSWQVPEGETESAPSTLTNKYASILGASVKIAATDTVGLMGLSLEKGAKIVLEDGAVVSTKLLFVNGQALDRDIYIAQDATGEGTKVDWIEGAGQVRVAGETNRGIPSVCLVPDADGWYTFGLDNGSIDTLTYRYFVAERPVWDDYRFRPGEKKLRLKGYVLLETVPDIFSEYDTTGLKFVIVNARRALAANRPFEVPANASIRFLPGTWVTSAGNVQTIDAGRADYTAMAGTDGEISLGTGAQFYVCGDGMPNITFGGLLRGEGNLTFLNFGRQMRFTGGFAINGTQGGGMQNGSGFWVDTLAVTSSLRTVTLGDCANTYGMTKDYSASYIMFGRQNSGAQADHPLHIGRLNGNASSRTDGNGYRWRSGGHVIVWGSNTVHVTALHAGLHVVGNRREQDCTNGYLGGGFGTSPGFGILAVDAFNSGTIWGSTNVALTVGTVAANAVFDYTYQSNGVNTLTLDITNACDTATTVRASDLAMLPARIRGFRGQVVLTDTTEKAYEIPVDLTVGAEGPCQTVGCAGSGTLAAAPATSTINVTFPTTGIDPQPGKYPLALFSAGGELLKNWTVTLNGEKVSEVMVNGHSVALRRTGRGLYLGVDLPGSIVIVK